LRRHPDAATAIDSELLFGETVRVFEEGGGWARVENGADGYTGYVAADALGPAGATPSHRVGVLRTFVYPAPDLKIPPRMTLSFLSLLNVGKQKGKFSTITAPDGGRLGWVFTAHLVPVEDVAPDFVTTALMFMGVPYLWGGRSSLGLDCSALVQLALMRAGIPCPRDSHQQATALGTPVPGPQEAPLRRGDLIFFPGHVAIALDETRVVHANAGAMLTAIEPLAAVEARVRAESGGRGITTVRRIVL